MSGGPEHTEDALALPQGELSPRRRTPPRRVGARYRKRCAVIGIAALPSVVLALVLLCEVVVPGTVWVAINATFREDAFFGGFLVALPIGLEGVVLVPGIYSLVQRSRRAGVVTLVLGAVAVLSYLAYTWILWALVLVVGGIGRHAGALGH